MSDSASKADVLKRLRCFARRHCQLPGLLEVGVDAFLTLQDNFRKFGQNFLCLESLDYGDQSIAPVISIRMDRMLNRIVSTRVPSFELDEFFALPHVPTEQFYISYNGCPIDIKYENNSSSVTTIFFHASLGSKIKKLPVFSGSRFSEPINSNRLFISDPTLNLHGNLRLSWYAGANSIRDLQAILSRVIKHITNGNRRIYFGASGGGFASLLYSAMDPGSFAVAVNPQTNIRDYAPGPVALWTNQAWGLGNSSSSIIQMPPVVTDLQKIYSIQTDNHVAYVQNINDTEHVDAHYSPFMLQTHRDNHTIPIEINGETGHVPPSNETLLSILQTIIESNDWNSLNDIISSDNGSHCVVSNNGQHDIDQYSGYCINCDALVSPKKIS